MLSTKINLTRLLEVPTRVRRIKRDGVPAFGNEDSADAFAYVISRRWYDCTSTDIAYSFELETEQGDEQKEAHYERYKLS